MIGRQTVLGAALAWTRPDGDEATERLFEAYWRVRCNQWIHVSPHLQWLDPFGAGDRFTLFGIRTQCDF